VVHKQQRDDFRVEPLGKAHDRAAFSCGSEPLDSYLQKQAGQDVAKHAAVCFLLTPDSKTVAGYYTLSQYSVDLVKLPGEMAKKLPKYPEVPTTLLGRLAISERFRGQKLGEFLLLDALHRCWQQSKQVASAAVIVDAKDEAAKRFYEHFEFILLPDTPRRLFLPMRTIENLFSDDDRFNAKERPE
jgi:predicted GNAT family N-acyltransferase